MKRIGVYLVDRKKSTFLVFRGRRVWEADVALLEQVRLLAGMIDVELDEIAARAVAARCNLLVREAP